MKLRTKFALVLISSSFAFATANAADNCPGMHCGDTAATTQDKTKMDSVAFANKRLSELKDKLNITPAEEPAWQTFADKVNAQAKATAALHEKMRAEMKSPDLTTPDRMAKMAEFMKIRSQHMAAMSEVVRTFYNTLSPEQKAVFDKMHLGRMNHKHGG